MPSPARQLGNAVRRVRAPTSRSVSASSTSSTSTSLSTASSSDVVVLDAWPSGPRVVSESEDEVVVLEHKINGVRLDDVGDGKTGFSTTKRSEANKPMHPFFLVRPQVAMPIRHPPPPQPVRPLSTSARTTTRPKTTPGSATPTMPRYPNFRSRSLASSSSAVATSSKARNSRSTTKTQSSTASSSVASSAPSEDAPILALYSHSHFTPSPHRVFTASISEANDLVPLLSGPLGLDMEWRFGFRGRTSWQGKTAVLQLADARMVIVIQVANMARLPSTVEALLADPERPKMGVNILADVKKLARDFPNVRPRGIVELSYLAKQVDKELVQNRRLVALAKLVEMYTGKKLDKAERTGDWEGVLREEQIEYAANDVHASMHIGRLLLARAEEQGITLNPSLYTVELAMDGPVAIAPKDANVPAAPVAPTAPRPHKSRTTSAAKTKDTPMPVEDPAMEALYARYAAEQIEQAGRWS